MQIEKLNPKHQVDDFDCGQPPLNSYLMRHALQNQRANAAQTYLAVDDKKIAGYYTLALAQIEVEDAPERLTKGLARYPVPLMLLARLAVNIEYQGQGLGAGLLKDAMQRTLNASEIAGIRALAVHAKDDSARDFYEHFGFIQSPTDPYHLFVLLKDVIAALKK